MSFMELTKTRYEDFFRTEGHSGGPVRPRQRITVGGNVMTNRNAPGSGADATASDNLVYFNGIDAETGQYAVKPQAVDDLAKLAPDIDAARIAAAIEMTRFP